MTLSDFNALTHEVFGAARAEHLVRSHVLTDLGGRTAAQAIDQGEEPKDVWLALSAEFDVPEIYR
ncbi:DUF3046 domain-containing protein [Dietzia sp.]|uniref:DUF3046 domain-containing protein n=1 Tax=Dietzia sp. TaxID=1871616 RepID=UPI002FDA13AA